MQFFIPLSKKKKEKVYRKNLNKLLFEKICRILIFKIDCFKIFIIHFKEFICINIRKTHFISNGIEETYALHIYRIR